MSATGRKLPFLTQVEARPDKCAYACGMPRYFFKFTGDLARDDLGIEMPDIETAFIEAVRGARSCIADRALRGVLSLSDEVEVSDDDGHVLFVVPFAEAVGGG
jgi:hypothetical protein